MAGSSSFPVSARWLVKTRSKRGELIAPHTRPTRSRTAPMIPAVSSEYPYGSCDDTMKRKISSITGRPGERGTHELLRRQNGKRVDTASEGQRGHQTWDRDNDKE